MSNERDDIIARQGPQDTPNRGGKGARARVERDACDDARDGAREIERQSVFDAARQKEHEIGHANAHEIRREIERELGHENEHDLGNEDEHEIAREGGQEIEHKSGHAIERGRRLDSGHEIEHEIRHENVHEDAVGNGGDDYLWDRSGPADPDIARLEETLAALRFTPSSTRAAWETAAIPAPHDTAPVAQDARHSPIAPTSPLPPDRSNLANAPEPAVFAQAGEPWRRRGGLTYVLPFAIAATLLAGVGIGWLSVSSVMPRASWEVAPLEGAPTVASRGIGEDGRLPVGEWLVTDANARARIKVGGIGRVDVDPHSRVGLLSARAGNYRLQLARGTMHALIWSPPGQFFVETPSSTAVDLGCAYTLRVEDDGSGMVEVTSGWVGFDWKGRESFIPAGAVCATRPGIGPGTPHYADVSPAFEAALRRLDFERVPPRARDEALTRVLTDARARDAVTLWHLLARVGSADRGRVFDRLASFVPPPAGVTREGIMAGRRDMRDRWWDELGLGQMSLWRGWKQGWREQR